VGEDAEEAAAERGRLRVPRPYRASSNRSNLQRRAIQNGGFLSWLIVILYKESYGPYGLEIRFIWVNNGDLWRLMVINGD
jgi:hypothetical protein